MPRTVTADGTALTVSRVSPLNIADVDLRPPRVDWKAPDYRPVYAYRSALLQSLRASPERMAAAQAVYAADPVPWIEDWAMTYDPRRAATEGVDAWMPFLLWPRQVEFIRWLQSRQLPAIQDIFDANRQCSLGRSR
jgi:hypothetical protein